jgi:hypothetical protein
MQMMCDRKVRMLMPKWLITVWLRMRFFAIQGGRLVFLQLAQAAKHPRAAAGSVKSEA